MMNNFVQRHGSSIEDDGFVDGNEEENFRTESSDENDVRNFDQRGEEDYRN